MLVLEQRVRVPLGNLGEYYCWVWVLLISQEKKGRVNDHVIKKSNFHVGAQTDKSIKDNLINYCQR